MLRTHFNDDWYVEKIGSDRAPVGPLSVPHDAMMYEHRDPTLAFGHNTGYFPGGEYRYTKRFHAPDDWQDKAVILEFEGVYHRSEVYLNGERVGGRPSGYALFHVALGDELKLGQKNELEVIARNADQPNSRWYTGSGIYRPVHLLVGDRVRVTPTGLRVSTLTLNQSQALIEVATEIVNSGATARLVTVGVTVSVADGGDVASAAEEVTIEPQETIIVRQRLSVADPQPWSPDSPVLHHARVLIHEDGLVVDSEQADFGIRVISADAKHGLRINGAVVKLRGAGIHHDNGVIGAHTLDAAEDRRVRILKESGYNAIRSAHNPLSVATLRACDKYGVLVMDELSDAWWINKMTFDYGTDFVEWWQRDLESMIAKDVNHPSVVLYSLGNELSETASVEGIEQSREMVSLVRALDPTRLTTNAINGFVNMFAPTRSSRVRARASAEAKEAGSAILIANLLIGTIEKVMHSVARLRAVDKKTRGIHATVDVAGYNYMHRRYEMDGRTYPDRVIVGTETQATSTAEIWREIERLPHVIGDFVWTGWDYIGEVGLAAARYDDKRRLFVPYPALLAGTPIIDITGFRQTQSYVNEIIWHLRRGPHLAVRPLNRVGHKRVAGGWRGSDSIRSWSWTGFEGVPATVEVYADAARVELLVDGTLIDSRSLRAEDNFLTVFTVPYRAGRLSARAYADDGSLIGEDALVTAGDDVHLRVTPEVAALKADGADLAYITIELTDNKGIVLPLADREVAITVTGAAQLLGFGSANPLSPGGFSDTRTTTYFGRALAVVRAGFEAGDVSIVVEADGCEPITMSLQVSAQP